MAKKLNITLKKSLIGRNQRQRATVKALGLRKIGHTVIHDDTPQIRGMIHKDGSTTPGLFITSTSLSVVTVTVAVSVLLKTVPPAVVSLISTV